MTAIKKTGKGVAVSYTQGGMEKQIEAAYCVMALPFEMLKKIPNDLSPEFKTVVDGSTPFGFYKVAWESRRFWERDYNIYGGISYLMQAPNMVWYPSANLFKPDRNCGVGLWGGAEHSVRGDDDGAEVRGVARVGGAPASRAWQGAARIRCSADGGT